MTFSFGYAAATFYKFPLTNVAEMGLRLFFSLPII